MTTAEDIDNQTTKQFGQRNNSPKQSSENSPEKQ